MLYEQVVTLRIKYDPETSNEPSSWVWEDLYDTSGDESVEIMEAGPVVVLQPKSDMAYKSGAENDSTV